jgi:hypothetical protein
MKKKIVRLAVIRRNDEDPCPFGLSIPFACKHASNYVDRMFPLTELPVDVSDETKKKIVKNNNRLLASSLDKYEGTSPCRYAGEQFADSVKAVECNFNDSAPGGGQDSAQGMPSYSKLFEQPGMLGLFSYPMGYYSDFNTSMNSYYGIYSLQGDISINNLIKLAENAIELSKNAAKDDVLKDKFPEHIALIDRLSNEDPSGPAKKYLEWMVKQAIAGFNLADIVPSVKYFHNNQHAFNGEQKDINSYKTAKDLEDLIKNIEFAKYEGDEDNKGNAENVYGEKSDRFIVIRPDDKDACIYYGKNSHWCITMRNAEHYEDYTSTNIIFYFIIDKLDNKNNMSKIAYAIYRDEANEILDYEIFDINDKAITDTKVKEYMGEDAFTKVLRIITTDAVRHGRTINYNDEKVQIATAVMAKDPERQWECYDDPNQRFNLAKNKSLTEEIQMLLFEEDDFFINQNLASNIGVDKEIMSLLLNNSDVMVKQRVLENPSLDKEFQLIIVNHWKDRDAAALSRNPSIDKEIQLLLLNRQSPFISAQLANNTSIDKEIQLKLSKSTSPSVVEVLASNTELDREIQLTLANSNNRLAKIELAKNESVDKEVQKILIKDDDLIRQILSGNPSLDRDVQFALANSNDEKIKEALAINPVIDNKIRLILINNSGDRIKSIVAETDEINKKIQLALLNSNNINIKLILASNHSIHRDIQQLLVKDERAIKTVLAKNPAITAEIQLILANDFERSVMAALWSNKKLTAEAAQILKDKRDNVI